MPQPVIFISYSHKDKEEKDELLAHLGVLQRQGLIDLWSDNRIGAGVDWKQEISEAMAQARVAILLISVNYLTSDFILDEEVPTLLRRRNNEGLTIFPVIAKACAWEEVDWLVGLNVRPQNGRAIWGGSRQVDEDLSAIAKEVAAIVRNPSLTPIIDRDDYNQSDLDSALLRSNYLNRLFELSSYLSLSGVDPKAATNEAQARLNLGAVYVAMLTYGLENQEEITLRKQPDQIIRVSAIAQLDQHRRLVLLGGPGSGKSTLVSFVAMCLAGEALGRTEPNLTWLTAPLSNDEGEAASQPQPWRHGPLLPVRVILRDFAAQGLPPVGERATADHLWRFIATDLEKATLKAYAQPLKQELLQQGGLILLDGLDEVPEAQQRRIQIKQAIEDFAATFGNCRILVTSRTYAYQKQNWQLSNFTEAILTPFSQNQIRRFVERWYDHIGELRGLKAEEVQGRAELLKQAIFNNDRLLGLAERPLLLTLMASLHIRHAGSLPERREELYADAVELLRDWWESPKIVKDAQGQAKEEYPGLVEWLRVDRNMIRAMLNELAYQAQAGQPELVGTADITQKDLIHGLLQLSQNPDVKPFRLIEYLSQRTGLLLPHGVGIFTFPHRSFQEYLAACYLVETDYPDTVAELARRNPDRWREVAQLAGAKAARDNPSAIWQLVDALCYHEPKPQNNIEDVWGAQLAGQALAETANLTKLNERNQLKLDRVRRWLVDILVHNQLTAIERAEAGRNLAYLGDPRPGIGLRADGLPDIVWGEVPDGPFIMGDDRKRNISAKKNEQPSHEVKLSRFMISRYPVTNQQYSAFVMDGGYTERWRICWTEAGWKWREAKTGPQRYTKVFSLPNHPIVGLTWYEAIAFCNWLTLRLREIGELRVEQTVRLPSEAEWEKAARGPLTDSEPTRSYPWREERLEPDWANYYETGLGATSAVGCFPKGRSLYECEDMIGNVWEWTRSLFQPYPYMSDDGREELAAKGFRVLRGGSWYTDGDNTRQTRRIKNAPEASYNSWGFRVIVSPI